MPKKKPAPKKKTGKKKRGSKAKKEAFRAEVAQLRKDLTSVAAILGITIGRLDDANTNGLVLDRVEHQTTLTEIANRLTEGVN